MVIYNLLKEVVINYEEKVTIVTYNTIEEAKKDLRTNFKKAVDYFKGFCKVEQNDMNFSVWTDGTYEANHITMKIIKSEIHADTYDFLVDYVRGIVDCSYPNMEEEKTEKLTEKVADTIYNSDYAWEVLDTEIMTEIEENMED